nr:hypothetical protein L204_01436 [Cryptococcus depauperatus CBS 7855]
MSESSLPQLIRFAGLLEDFILVLPILMLGLYERIVRTGSERKQEQWRKVRCVLILSILIYSAAVFCYFLGFCRLKVVNKIFTVKLCEASAMKVSRYSSTRIHVRSEVVLGLGLGVLGTSGVSRSIYLK